MATVTVNITVTSDEATPVALEGVRWTIKDAGDTTVYDSGLTDSSGETGDVLLEDDTTYNLYLKKPYTAFSAPESLPVSATTDPQSFTFTGAYDPQPGPTGDDLCTVYGTLFNPDGSPYALQAVLVDNLYGAVDLADRSVMGHRAEVVTDSNGRFEIEVFRGATVRITVQGTRKSFRVEIPDQDEVDIVDLEASAEDEIQDVVRG